MFLFDLLFGKKPETPAAPTAGAPAPARAAAPAVAPGERVAPGTDIHHHPDLIARFMQDHQELLRLFGAVKEAAEVGNVTVAAERLEDFRTALQGHLLTENIRLYVYLEHALLSDPPSHALMHQFRHEMDEIGKAVVAFLTKYHDLAAHPEWARDFVNELDGVGKVLVKRIQSEEKTLYPLYLPM